MAQLIVKGVQDYVKRRLEARAANHGQSIEAEVRDILLNALKDDAVGEEAGLGTQISRRFSDIGLEIGEELERPDWGGLKSPFEG